MKNVYSFFMKETLGSANSERGKCPYIAWAVRRSLRISGPQSPLGVSPGTLMNLPGFFEHTAFPTLQCMVKPEVSES